MKLYIIGNGFDLHHRLPTSTNDFIKFIEIEDIDENYVVSGVNWSEYENALSYFDVDEMCEQFVGYPDYLSDRESDRDGVIFEMQQKTATMQVSLNNALNKMISTTENMIENNSVQIVNDKVFYNNSIILSFNYTSTIESLYDLNNNSILHIHGYYSDREKLVFGYSQPDKSVLDIFESRFVSIPGRKDPFKHPQSEDAEVDYPDYYVQQQYDEMYNYYISNQKHVRLEELSNWIEPYIKDINEIIVLGHSMGAVDKPYFELLEQKINPPRWIISQYGDSPHIDYLSSYSFSNKISFCTIDDYIS